MNLEGVLLLNDKEVLRMYQANQFHGFFTKNQTKEEYMNIEDVRVTRETINELLTKIHDVLDVLPKPIFDDIKWLSSDYDIEQMLLYADNLNAEILSFTKFTEVASQLLPTKRGHKFGSQEYGFQYALQLIDAYSVIKDLVETMQDEDVCIYRCEW